MAITIREDIKKLQDLISDDGETMMLFGKVVTIDPDTGVVSLADPDDNDD